MTYESFCIACIAAPLALAITNSNYKVINLKKLMKIL